MKWLESIATKAEQSALQHTWSKGLMRCPHCEKPPTQAPKDTNTIYRCTSCGFEAFPDAWTPAADGIRKGKPDEIPANTRIRREKYGPRDCIWHIPASGKFGFFFYFGLIWTTFTAIMAGFFVFASEKENGPDQAWFLVLFFAVFFAVGIGCLYVAVRNKYALHRITVSRDRVAFRRELLGKVTEKSLLTSEVTVVEQNVFYQQNYQPVYGIEIQGNRRKIRFGTTLDEAEKAWLVADLQRCIFGTDAIESFVEFTAFPSPQNSAINAQDSFDFLLPAPVRGLWILGLAFAVLGLGGLIFAGYQMQNFFSFGAKDEPWFARVFDLIFSAFSIIPLIVGVAFTVVGAIVFMKSRPNGDRQMRIEGEATQVFLRSYQRGVIVKEQAFSRTAIKGVIASRSGHMNNQEIKQIALIIDNKRIVLTRATAGSVADAWVEEVNRSLGVETHSA
jgi:uncharacterized membrane protein/ribosomal protein L37AE/L43A